MPAMVGLRFDLRGPSFAKTTHEQMYAACLEMSEWADAQGFEVIAISSITASPTVHVVAR